MTNPNVPAPPNQPAGITPEVVAQLVTLQTRQLEIRQQEIEVQRLAAETERQKGLNAHDFALKALAAQAEDRKDERQKQAGTTRYGFWILLLVILGVVGLVGYALYANKDQLILEALKAILYASGGGGFGFAIGFRKGREERPTPSPTPSAT